MLVAAILGMAVVWLLYGYQSLLSDQSERLRSLARLQARQLAEGIREAQVHAQLIRSSPLFLHHQAAWHRAIEKKFDAQTQLELTSLATGLQFDAVLAVNGRGEPVVTSGQQLPVLSSVLRGLIQRSQADAQMHWAGPYTDDLGILRLDFVVPLVASGPSPSMLVFRM